MRFFIVTVLVALAAWLGTWLVSWQMIAVCAFFIAPAASRKAGRCFWAGFLGIFLLWLAAGLWQDVANDHLLSSRLAKIFFVQEGYLYLCVAALIGGLVGGLSGWAGAIFFKAFLSRNSPPNLSTSRRQV